MSNVLKFDQSKKREPEPEKKKPKPQESAVRFVMRSAIIGPLGSALLLVVLFSFSDIWNAITNPLVAGYWVQLGKAFGFALVLGLLAAGISLAFFAPYALSIGRGLGLIKTTFVRRAMMAGGTFGFVAVLVLNMLIGVFDPASSSVYSSPDLYIGLGVGTIAGILMAFLWAHICWLTLLNTSANNTNSNKPSGGSGAL